VQPENEAMKIKTSVRAGDINRGVWKAPGGT
jgi:hypothetical protein